MEAIGESPLGKVQTFTYVVDPDGDLVLILGDAEVERAQVALAETKQSSQQQDEEDATKYLQTESTTTETAKTPLNINQVHQSEIHIRVSSKHLTLASRVFKAMLRPGFAEGSSLQEKGTGELHLPDDDPSALLVLMNLAHCQIRRIPRRVDLDMLTQLSILVDKYELHEITEMFTDSWFSGLKAGPPEHFTEELLSWISVSYVFRREEIFTKCTKIAMRESEGIVESPGLPIPDYALRAINTTRERVISELFSHLQSKLAAYQNAGYTDSDVRTCCIVTTLGSLTLGLQTFGLLYPLAFPYDSLSFKQMVENLRSIKLPHYCKELGNWGACFENEGDLFGRDSPRHKILGKIDTLEAELQGVKLVL